MSSVISGLIGQTPSILICYVIDDLDLFAGIEGLDQAKDIIFKICFIYDYFYFQKKPRIVVRYFLTYVM